jgi:hypothetical protein
MVRRGSTVRVRQSSLQSPCKSAFFLLAPLAELPTCARYGAVYGARRVRKLVRRPPRRWAGRVGCSVVLEGRLLALVVRVSRLPQPVRAGTAARSSQPQRGECLASACGQPTVRPPRFGSSVVPTAPPFHRASGTVGHSTVRVDEHQARFVRVEDEVVGRIAHEDDRLALASSPATSRRPCRTRAAELGRRERGRLRSSTHFRPFPTPLPASAGRTCAKTLSVG